MKKIALALSAVVFFCCVDERVSSETKPRHEREEKVTPAGRDGVGGRWHDHRWNETVTVYKQNGKLFVKDVLGSTELERWNVPSIQGESYAIVDRVGSPDNLYVIQPDGRLGFWTNCEFGPCDKKRTMEQLP